MAISGAKRVERRQFGRHECCIEALVTYRDQISYSCVIRNFSQFGAVLEFEPGVEAPNEFTLRLASNGAEGACSVRHRTGSRVGVAFVSGTLGIELDTEHQQHLAQAEFLRVAPPAPAPERQRQQAPRHLPTSPIELRRNIIAQLRAPTVAEKNAGSQPDTCLERPVAIAPEGNHVPTDETPVASAASNGAAGTDPDQQPASPVATAELKQRGQLRPKLLILPI